MAKQKAVKINKKIQRRIENKSPSAKQRHSNENKLSLAKQRHRKR
jgi:hypothetical protein